MKETLAVIASVVAVAGYAPYLRDVITRRVKPHPYTWLLWSVVTGITLAGQIVSGAGVGAIPTLVSEVLTIFIFIFTLQYGFKNIVKLDNYFLAIALLGLIPWAITKNPTISVIIAVSIDLIAFAPTIRKTWLKPKTETPILYGNNVVKHIFTLLSLQNYNIVTTLHSIAMIFANSIMTTIIVFKKPRKVAP